MIEIKNYRTEHGVEPFQTFFQSMKDAIAKTSVTKAISKIESGLPGDVRSLGGGVKEYKIHVGKGHRIYFYNDGQQIIILLAGSDKKDQDREIENARKYLADYKRQQRKAKKEEALK